MNGPAYPIGGIILILIGFGLMPDNIISAVTVGLGIGFLVSGVYDYVGWLVKK